MKTKTYRVTCSKCHESDNVVIDDANNIYWKPVKYIISGRFRLDSQWGWQCMCGNNDLLTKQELREIHNLQEPDPYEIAKVSKNPIRDRSMFNMEIM